MKLRNLATALSALILLSACSGRDSAENLVAIDIEGGSTNAAAGNGAQTSEAASCAAALTVEVAEPFGSPDTSFGADHEALRSEAGDLFKAVAGRMCAAGLISPASMAPYRRLLIQYGGGADNTAIYADPEQFGRDTLLFQYAFEAGDDGKFMLPDENDVYEGLLCHLAAVANEEMCNDRLP